MSSITAQNEAESNVAERAIAEYHKRIEHLRKQKAFLETQTFHMGDYVLFVGRGGNKDQICKIVGWDFNYRYYRVYVNENVPFMGAREERLRKFDGDVAEHMKQVDPFAVKYIGVNLTDEVMGDGDMDA